MVGQTQAPVLALLKKMTRSDNARVRDENKTTAPATAKVIPFPQPEPIPAPAAATIPVIVFEDGFEVEKPFPEEKYHEYLAGGMLEVTLFGTVPSVQAKSEAEQVARSVDGVKTVHNELVVKSDERAAATQ